MQALNYFSVVIPLYNKGKEILTAIESVLNQTHQAFEIIVVNDGSTDDGPRKVMNQTDPRIRLISQENQGVSAARNRGIEEAKYDMIAFLDGDDFWEKDYLEVINRIRTKFPEAGMYATAYATRFEGRNRECRLHGIPAHPWEGILHRYFDIVAHGDAPFWTGTVTIPKKILKQVGNFKEKENIGEDLDLWGRIALKFPIAFSTTKCAVYDRDASNRTDASAVSRYRETPFVKTVSRAVEIGEVPRTVLSDLNNYVARLHLEISRKFISGKRPGIALQALSRSKPTSIQLKTRKLYLLLLAMTPDFARPIFSIFPGLRQKPAQSEF